MKPISKKKKGYWFQPTCTIYRAKKEHRLSVEFTEILEILEEDQPIEKDYVPNAQVKIKRENIKEHRKYKNFIDEGGMETSMIAELRQNV